MKIIKSYEYKTIKSQGWTTNEEERQKGYTKVIKLELNSKGNYKKC
jgi:hypothetical protein